MTHFLQNGWHCGLFSGIHIQWTAFPSGTWSLSWFRPSGWIYRCWLVWRCFSIHSSSLLAVQERERRAVLLAAVRGTQAGVAVRLVWVLQLSCGVRGLHWRAKSSGFFLAHNSRKCRHRTINGSQSWASEELSAQCHSLPPKNGENKFKEKKSNRSFSNCDFDPKIFWKWILTVSAGSKLAQILFNLNHVGP